MPDNLKLPLELSELNSIQEKINQGEINHCSGFYSSGSDYLVFIGFESELDFLTAAYFFNMRKIVVIENDKQKLSTLKKILHTDSSLKKRVFIYFNLFSPLLRDKLIDCTVSVKVDLNNRSVSELNNIIETWSIQYICGEINPQKHDIYNLWHLCRTHVDHFYWTMSDKTEPLVGQRSTLPFDITVIVPVYNISTWIDQCVSSLVAQTHENIEIILVDDGSTDDSALICDSWQKKHSNKIKVIHKKNGGCASARNAGLKAARGKYIGFVDGDDWVDPAMFSELLYSAIKVNAQIAQCGYQEVYECGEVIAYPLNAGISRLDILGDRPTIWRRIYDKNFLDNTACTFPEKIKRFDDLPFQFETIYNASVISTVPNSYYNYRQGRVGQDIAIRDNRLYVHFDIFEYLYLKLGDLLNYEEEMRFFELQLDVHNWAASIIDEKFKTEYIKRASEQIFTFKYTINLMDMLRAAKRKRKLLFFLKIICT